MLGKMTSKTVVKGKRKQETQSGEEIQSFDLFVDAPPDASDGSDDGDSTDSEDSEYSGLEEEEDDSDDEDVESFEEASSSNDEDVSEDAESDEEEDDSEDESMKKEVPVKQKHKANGKKEKQSTTKQKLSKIKTKGKPVKDTKAATTSGTSVTPTTSSAVPDEYDFDSSDEEDIRNTIGNIPVEWYRDFEHLGYDWDGKKIGKPKAGDQLDKFLDKMENPNFWRTVKDKMTGQNVVLSDEDVEIIQRLKRSKYVDANLNPYEAWVDFFTHEKMIHPVTNHPAHKRSFIPSKWERLKVGRMVHAMKMGWMKPTVEKKEDDDEEDNYYMIWDKDDQNDPTNRYRAHIPAPKMALPGHEESYNPPPEYLLTEEEQLAWKEKEPEERKLNFIPEKYSCLRHVPSYQRFINERFERCLDLYLCPRQRKMRMNVNPEDLLPKLPKPQDLQPFPTTQALIYKGHMGLVRCIDADPTGQWLISGSDDKTVRLWEVSTGRCMKTIPVDDVVKFVSWNPNPALCLAVVALENDVLVLNPQLGDKLVHQNTDNVLNSYIPAEQAEAKKMPVEWHTCDGDKYMNGLRLVVKHSKKITQVTWHTKGDYFAVVMPEGESQSVFIHQLSKRRSQNPFRKPKGLVQCVLFHPTRPFFFVATQRYVRIYNLLKQELTKKLMTNCKWVSSMAVHPGGDNLIIGSYDSRLSWFDLDLSNKPYQTLRHHKKALREVCYHKRYPLFASASDDGTVIVCHGMVYNDLLQNPLIVPVKILRGHSMEKNLGVLSCKFHPTQPWLFTSGADSTIRLYT